MTFSRQPASHTLKRNARSQLSLGRSELAEQPSSATPCTFCSISFKAREHKLKTTENALPIVIRYFRRQRVTVRGDGHTNKCMNYLKGESLIEPNRLKLSKVDTYSDPGQKSEPLALHPAPQYCLCSSPSAISSRPQERWEGDPIISSHRPATYSTHNVTPRPVSRNLPLAPPIVILIALGGRYATVAICMGVLCDHTYAYA
ncbi:hypothetical protein C8Q73DRAFT_362778 [Cubamyces lactineus]|nr:hypothetical protein C8Q73DRAFT_362778 [Cubamyces lactineus]